MLALLLVPAFLGLAFMVDSGDDADTTQFEPIEDTDQPVEGLPTEDQNEQPVETALQSDFLNFVGSDAQDIVTGTDGDNDISGQSGDDILDGRGGDDVINGESGNDTIFAGGGSDFAVGGIGNDNVFLGSGDDIYSPLDLDDDSMDRGDDQINGGDGDDGILDFRGSDTLIGGAGNDILGAFGFEQTPDGVDSIDGGEGNDTLFGDNGDAMIGGAGEDLFAVIRPEAYSADAVTIEDFDVSEDVLTLFVSDAGTDGEEVDLQFDPEQNALRAFWRGEEVAVLNGLNSSDIQNIEISVLNAEDIASIGLI